MEAKLHKLKVTELKELLAKHHLTQTGKKDELVKRLLDNNIAVDDSGEEELVDPEANGAEGDTSEPSAAAPAAAAAEPTSTDSAIPSTSAPAAETSTPAELTPEQQAMKARAERFGIPFNPNPTPRQSTKQPKQTKPTPEAAASEKPAKAGAIDKTSLGLSEDLLAKRAAKFGLPVPEKKSESAQRSTAPAPAPAPEPSKKPEADLTPEMAEKIALEEEKKRKRAEKFGTGKQVSNGTSTEEPDAKKAKV